MGAIGQDAGHEAVEALAQGLVLMTEGGRLGHRQDGFPQQADLRIGLEDVRGAGGDDDARVHLAGLEGGDEIGMPRQVDDLGFGVGTGHVLVLDGAGEDGDAPPGQVVQGAPAALGWLAGAGGGGPVPLRRPWRGDSPWAWGPKGLIAQLRGQVAPLDQGRGKFMVIGDGEIHLGPAFIRDGEARQDHVDLADGQ